jgi:Icc protein
MAAVILQFTDCHLFADPAGQLKGVCTDASFQEVLRAARRQFPNPDAVILTGDLAHDEQPETYRRLCESLGEWLDRCHVIPGNHDSRADIGAVFRSLVMTKAESIVFSRPLMGWQLVGLDSQLPGQIAGALSADQLDWLAGELAQHWKLPTLLFVHHPPVTVGSRWIDRLRLQDADRLLDLVARSPQVRAIAFGHIHQEYFGCVGSAELWSTPSTGVQFAPRTDEMEIDPVPPGYRVFELDGSKMSTRVVRVRNSTSRLFDRHP